MSLRPDTIRPPAQIRKIERARVLTYRHKHSRRIFKAHDVDGEHFTISTRNGARKRRVTKDVLERDLTRVVPCPGCRGHHDIHRPRVHA